MKSVNQLRPPGSGLGDEPCAFPTTRWTLIVAAGHAAPDELRRALSELCEAYWYPVYAFIRRDGADAERALDLTQGFFARLLEKGDLADVDRNRGKFRSWLLASAKHFVANEHDRERAAKRGGGRAALSIDAADAESRYRLEPSSDMTPDRVFERRWALTLLGQVLDALRQECADEGRLRQFEVLKDCLAGGDGVNSVAAQELGMSDAGVRMAVHRLRRRYRELLRWKISQTVETPEQVEEEIEFLFGAVG
jgi:RNA polymerase sigma-70 factor (ECF subfamily)